MGNSIEREGQDNRITTMTTGRKPPIEWQNLIEHKCPKCYADLQIKENHRGQILSCEDRENCTFQISASKCREIILDENHMLRRHLTLDQALKLKEILDNQYGQA